ncbi:hypothetical protein O6H91_Y050700 [Diphasiastrum complanatum]|nr:hypothetical protein O6H91_Y050700 [Diphasiastrum complanatum]
MSYKMRKVGYAVLQAVKFGKIHRALGSMEGLTINKEQRIEITAQSATEKGKAGVLNEYEQNSGRSSGIKTPFSPAVKDKASSGESSGTRDSPPCDQNCRKDRPPVPERHLTLVALRLAVLEKSASGLGVMAFVWATVVLLGGFVSSLKVFDFWVISVLLLTEGTRVFSRSHELEWQHIASRSISLPERVRQASSTIYQRGSSALHRSKGFIHSALDGFIHNPVHSATRTNSDQSKEENADVHEKVPIGDEKVKKGENLHPPLGLDFNRTWSWDAVPFIPYFDRFVVGQASRFLILLQLASALVSIGLSVARLSMQNYTTKGTPSQNVSSALNIFYALVLAEALIFLLEKAYWEMKITLKKMLERVNMDCQLGEENLDLIKEFFYDVYACCLNGSVFDGLDMDLVGYSIGKIQSNSGREQLGGIRILASFASSQDISGSDTLRRIGTTPGIIDRLLEMLTWKNEHEKEIRQSTAKIVRELVRISGNCSRVVAVAGALECLLTLITKELDHTSESNDPQEEINVSMADLNLKLFGLEIFKDLSRIYSNCVQIGSIPGLIPILVDFLDVSRIKDSNSEADEQKLRMKIFERSLQLLKVLTSTTGTSGYILRDRIKRTVSILTSLRDVLKRCSSHPKLQCYAMDIITSLALDEQTRESIGSTGGVIPLLLSLFFMSKREMHETEPHLNLKAGNALNLLVLGSPRNCRRIVRSKLELDAIENLDHRNITDVLQQLVQRLEMRSTVGTCTAEILSKMFEYLDPKQKAQVATAAALVVRTAVDDEENPKHREGAIGLASCIISFIDAPSYESIFTQGFDKAALVYSFMRLVKQIIPHTRLARIRRHTAELALALMRKDELMRNMFGKEGLENDLQVMLDTISDSENYCTFSGPMGLARHLQSMEDLLELAISELHKEAP